MKISRLLLGLMMALALVGGRFMVAPAASAEPTCVEDCGDGKKKAEVAPAKEDDLESVVVIDGGTVTSETVIDISVDGGTAISDASGGDDNFAFTTVDAVGGDDDTGGGGGVLGLRDELVGGDDAGVAGDVAAAGNGGTADASANGGAVSVGDINSGGNAGNTITVGNTGGAVDKPVVDEKKPEAPKPVAPKPVAPKPDDGGKKVVDDGGAKSSDGGSGSSGGGAKGGDKVKGLPSTGVGVAGSAGTSGALILLFGAMGVAGLAIRRRLI